MQQALTKLKPTGGLPHVFHVFLLALLPIILFVLVRLDFVTLALSLIIISKWRMFAVKPRFWLVNIRANAVDILVGLSVVLFMAHFAEFGLQVAWALAHIIWLTVIKPGASIVMNALQSMTALLLSQMALFMVAGDLSLLVLVMASGLICFAVAHHFLSSFDEPYTKFLAYCYAFMGAAITWILGHWLLYYGILAQPALLIIVIGYGLGGLYYFDHHDRLSRIIKMEFAFIMIAIVIINLAVLAISSSSGSII